MIGFVLRKWKLLTKFILSFFGIVIIGGAFVCQYLAVKIFIPKANQFVAEVQKHQDAILKDLKLLEAKPIFSYTHHTKNVQEFLSQHISW